MNAATPHKIAFLESITYNHRLRYPSCNSRSRASHLKDFILQSHVSLWNFNTMVGTRADLLFHPPKGHKLLTSQIVSISRREELQFGNASPLCVCINYLCHAEITCKNNIVSRYFS